MKISIIGASGKVGSELIRLLAEQETFFNKVDIVLYSPNNHIKIQGTLCDIEEALLIRNKTFSKNINFIPSNKIEDISHSNLIIISAGIFANKEEKTKLLTTDSSGRIIQAYKNQKLIQNLCQQINSYTPNATILIITNQVDIMSEIARQQLKSAMVYGLGCYLDTIRFNKIFAELTHLRQTEFNATILGFHNKDLFIQDSNFQIFANHSNIEAYKKLALQKTITRGKEISDMQKDTHYPDMNSGSSKLPAAALFNIIEAFTQPNKKLTVPLNRKLHIEEANISSAQMPCQITYNSISNVFTKLSTDNLKKLQIGAKTFNMK